MSKRSGIGTTGRDRWHSDPGFMRETFIDEETNSERRDRESSQRRRGICVQCHRPMHLSVVNGGTAQLVCQCGYRTTVSTRTQAYKNAVLLAGGGR